MTGPGLSYSELRGLGVRRISVGGALARVALSAMMSAAEQLKEGSFDGLANAGPGRRINEIFSAIDSLVWKTEFVAQSAGRADQQRLDQKPVETLAAGTGKFGKTHLEFAFRLPAQCAEQHIP